MLKSYYRREKNGKEEKKALELGRALAKQSTSGAVKEEEVSQESARVSARETDRAATVGAVLFRRSATLRDRDGTPDYLWKIGLVLGRADDQRLSQGWWFIRKRRTHLIVARLEKEFLVLEAVSLRNLSRKWMTEEEQVRLPPEVTNKKDIKWRSPLEIANEIVQVCGWAGPGPYPWEHPATFHFLDLNRRRARAEERKTEATKAEETIAA